MSANTNKNTKFPCINCAKSCRSNQNCLCCDVCNNWIHLTCTRLNNSQFQKLAQSDEAYFCIKCLQDSLPFLNEGPNKSSICVSNTIEDCASKFAIDCEYVDLLKFNEELTSFATQISIVHFNTRSLEKNLHKIEELLNEVSKPLDIMCITETKLQKVTSNLNNVKLKNYEFTPEFSATNAGGVGIYVHESIVFKKRPELIFHLERCENLWIELLNQNKKIVIGVVYRHPSDNYQCFLDSLIEVIQKLQLEKTEYYILGDFNVNSCNNLVQNYVNALSCFGCDNIITSPTRITAKTATLLDHIYTNSYQYSKVGILEYDISDHLPIYTIINSHTQKKEEKVFLQNINEKSMESFLEDLNEALPFVDIPTYDINTKFSQLVSTIQTLTDKHFPPRPLSRKQTNLYKKPWLTKGIMKSIRQQNRLFHLCYKKHQKDKIEEYKKFRNKLTHIKETAKQNYYKNKIDQAGSDSGKTWKVINELMKKNVKSNNIPHELVVNDKHYSNQQDICDQLNEHFATIGKKLGSSIKPNKEIYSEYMQSAVSNSFVLFETEESEISFLIDQLNAKKATGHDDITAKVIKMSKIVLVPFLTKFINEAMMGGVFPTVLKIAKVIPLYKGGEKCNPTNYRPISLLTHISKVFEKILNSRLVSFIEKNKILTNHQYGFRKNYSTTLAITDLYESLLEKKERGEISCLLFLDFAKAFDTVDHSILLKKLRHYGIRGLGNNILASYLSDRQQFISQNNIKSVTCDITCGVPQGSILGPLLFTLYINDLPTITSLETRLFADDTALCTSSTNTVELQKKMTQEFDKVVDWLAANKLSLNVAKSVYMIISKHKTVDFTIKVKKQIVLKNVSEYKYLGVYIDKDLSWSAQINFLCKRLAKTSGVLYKIRNCINAHALLMLYHTMVKSVLQYGILSWGSASKYLLDPLEVTQNKILRIITFSGRRTNLAKLYMNMNVLPVSKLYLWEVCKFVFKFKENLLPVNFSLYFNKIKSVHSYGTRSSQTNYFLPRVATQGAKKSLRYKCPFLWKKLPQSLTSIKSLTNFSKKLRQYLIDIDHCNTL